MNKKELEERLERLENLIKKHFEIENIEPTLTFKDIKVGESFKYKDLEFTKLEENFALIDTYNDEYSDCVWDNVNNDYDKSLIRHYINRRYLDLMGIDEDDLLPVYNDDLVTLITKEQYEEHRDNIKSWDRWWATRSTSSGYAGYFCGISSYGNITGTSVNLTFGVRAGFNFKPDTIVSK